MTKSLIEEETLNESGNEAETLIWYIKHANSEEEAIEHTKSILSSTFESGEKKGAEGGGYIVHEVHGEGGRTTDGDILYWAKVRKLQALKTNQTKI